MSVFAKMYIFNFSCLQLPAGTVRKETRIQGRKQGTVIKLATEEPHRPGFIRLDNTNVECSYSFEEVRSIMHHTTDSIF